MHYSLRRLFVVIFCIAAYCALLGAACRASHPGPILLCVMVTAGIVYSLGEKVIDGIFGTLE